MPQKKWYWNDIMDGLLRRLYDPTVRGRSQEIAARLKVPRWAVNRRAAALGLSRPKDRPWADWQEWSRATLARCGLPARPRGQTVPCLRSRPDVIVPPRRTERRIGVLEVSLGELGKDELKLAAGLLGRAFRDNPTVIATNRGGSSNSRMLAVQRGMGRVVAMMERPPLVARRREWLVGVFAIAPPGTCRLPLTKSIRLMPGALLSGPGVTARGFRLMREWQKRDPDEPHWHVGPIGVEPALQGMSVGSQMLERFCAEMDSKGDLAYLETDKAENERLYERFGFVVTSEADIIGVNCWFMIREPKAPGRPTSELRRADSDQPVRLSEQLQHGPVVLSF